MNQQTSALHWWMPSGSDILLPILVTLRCEVTKPSEPHKKKILVVVEFSLTKTIQRTGGTPYLAMESPINEV